MSSELSYTLAFLIGLGGAVHCLGMCSGLAAGWGVAHGVGMRWLPPFVYHLTRIGGYAGLGAAGAALGRVLVQSGIIGKGQGVLMILAGFAVIVLAVRHGGWWPRVNMPIKSVRRVRFMPRMAQQPSRFAALGGVFNALIPCGLVFSVALPAAATGDPLRGALLMASFGLGTLPAMFIISLAAAILGVRFDAGSARKIVAVILLALGLWTLYQGWIFFDIMRGLANW
ncbi:MAG: sulfite exporter TauE/SafE family protein [Thiotrichales bacterium]